MLNSFSSGKYGCFEKALINFGNVYRIKKAFQKAEKGEKIVLGFLGGSVTEGAGSGDQMCYAEHIADMFAKKFPNCEVVYKNAGMGATGSILGVFRMDEDILCEAPDILVIDYNVNDVSYENEFKTTKFSYEGVIRKALKSGAAVIPLCVCNKAGKCTDGVGVEVAKHYDIPFISMKSGIFEPLIESGVHQWIDYSSDYVHPNPQGHRMLAELVMNYMELAYKGEADEQYSIPDSLYGDIYSNTEFLNASTLCIEDLGSFEIKDEKFRQFKGGWLCSGGTEPMRFTVKGCKIVHIAFLKNPDADYGRVKLTANGEEYILDGSFENGWGKFVTTCELLNTDAPTDAEVKVTPVDESKSFNILRVMVAR